MWHCEVRDGPLVMKMSSMLFCLVGVVIICSVWVVRSMSKKRLLMSTRYECPCMVQSGQLMSGRLRSPPTQSTKFLCLDVRSSMVLHMSSIYCRSLFGGRCIAAIMMCLLLLRCILVAVISNCVEIRNDCDLKATGPAGQHKIYCCGPNWPDDLKNACGPAGT